MTAFVKKNAIFEFFLQKSKYVVFLMFLLPGFKNTMYFMSQFILKIWHGILCDIMKQMAVTLKPLGLPLVGHPEWLHHYPYFLPIVSFPFENFI